MLKPVMIEGHSVLVYIQDGRTALFQACKNGRLAVLRLLLQKHADASIRNEVCELNLM